MLIEGVKYLSQDIAVTGLPHLSNDVRLPTTREGIDTLKDTYRGKNRCLSEFFNRSQDKSHLQTIMGLIN